MPRMRIFTVIALAMRDIWTMHVSTLVETGRRSSKVHNLMLHTQYLMFVVWGGKRSSLVSNWGRSRDSLDRSTDIPLMPNGIHQHVTPYDPDRRYRASYRYRAKPPAFRLASLRSIICELVSP